MSATHPPGKEKAAPGANRAAANKNQEHAKPTAAPTAGKGNFDPATLGGSEPLPWPSTQSEEIAEADRMELLLRNPSRPRSNKAVVNVFALLDEIDRKSNQ